MKAKFFLRLMLALWVLTVPGRRTVRAEDPGIPGDSSDYYSYCLSHREYPVDPLELEAHPFVSDLAGGGLAAEVRPSCNFSRRIDADDIRAIVIHYTNGSAEGALSWWQLRYPGTSAHYLITREGRIIQSVPEKYAAFHLGCYWSESFCRNCPDALCDNRGYFYDPAETTIAVELENAGPLIRTESGYTDIFKVPVPDSAGIFHYTGGDPLYHASRIYEAFPEAQLASLEQLIADLERRYGKLLILGHSDIQQISVDPGPAFPYARFPGFVRSLGRNG